MSEFIDKFFLPIATGTAFGFIINWLLEVIRLKNRRKRILNSLFTYLQAMPRYNLYNQTATNPKAPPKHIVPMLYPVVPFEKAVFSENNIEVSNSTIQATIDYLIKATELNALIQSLQTSRFVSEQDETIRLTRQFIFDQADKDMPQIVSVLKSEIRKEQKWWAGVRRLVENLRRRNNI
jgi:hypothetical protein